MSDYKRREISVVTFECVSRSELHDMERKTLEMILDICDGVGDQNFRTNTYRTLQNTGSDSARVRSSRAAPVCLVLLCFLLLTAVIVLSVLIYTNNTNYTQERNQLLTRIANITEERHTLLTRNTNLTEERDELLKKNGDLSNKIDLLEKQPSIIAQKDGWIYHQISYYYVSNERKNWAESRKDCEQRGADLVIINDREEHDFVMNFTRGKECWIGLTDSVKESEWKWVDGSSMTSGFWASHGQHKEPNDKDHSENCVVTYLEKVPDLLGWLDDACDKTFQWICEKRISLLTVHKK